MLFLGLFLGILPGLSQNDTIIGISLEELRVITKMTEDLRYTKAELEVADSVILHQQEIINLKDQDIDLKTQEINENLKKSTKKQIKVGVISGVVSAIIGLVLGLSL